LGVEPCLKHPSTGVNFKKTFTLCSMPFAKCSRLWLEWDEPVSDCFRGNLFQLVDSGVIEQISRGRGTRYVLSRQFYEFMGKKGTYTRKRGLDRETNKMLLLKHIKDNQKEGSPLGELMQVLPMFSRRQVQRLVEELEGEGRICGKGKTRARLWYSTEFAPKE